MQSNVLKSAILGFIYPFGGLIYSLRNYKTSGTQILFYIFCLFVGFNFMYFRSNDPNMITDVSRIATWFIELSSNKDYPLRDYLIQFGGGVDIYGGCIAYLVSRFTTNPRFLFLTLAAVQGFFTTKIIWFVFNNVEDRLTKKAYMLLVALLFVAPIWMIAGMRWTLALEVFVYGLLGYVWKGNKLSLLWCASSILIHFSFIMICVALAIYCFLPKRQLKLYFLFYVACVFISNIDLSFIQSVLDAVMPTYTDERMSYVSEEYVRKVSERRGNSIFLLKYYNEIYKYLLLVLMFIVYQSLRKNFNEIEIKYQKLLICGLFFMGVSEMFSSVPTASRFLALGRTLFLIFFILHLINHNNFKLGKAIVYSMPLFLCLLFADLRKAANVLNLHSFFGNFISSYFFELDTPIGVFLFGS